MALKVELKPGEKILIGDCVLTNGDQRARFLLEGSVPILREKDIMSKDRADTPARRLYLIIQLMYVSHDPREHHDIYFSLIRDITQAAPSAWPLIENINNQILTGDLYKALKHAKKLIEYEQELFQHATRGQGIRNGSAADRKSA